jgi:hypothetical protein
LKLMIIYGSGSEVALNVVVSMFLTTVDKAYESVRLSLQRVDGERACSGLKLKNDDVHG